MNKIEKIQQQGLKFLENIDAIESAIDLASNKDSLVSLYLTDNSYGIAICDKSERPEFDAYISQCLTYAEIVIPPCEIATCYVQIKFEVDNLIGRLIDNEGTEAIIESFEVSIYHISTSRYKKDNDVEVEIIRPFFILSLAGTEFKIAPGERIKELLNQEIELNRGYALEAIYGLVKWFGIESPYPRLKSMFETISDDLVNRLYVSLSGYIVVSFDRVGRRFLEYLGVANDALNWIEKAIASASKYDQNKYDQTKKRLEQEAKNNTWDTNQEDTNQDD